MTNREDMFYGQNWVEQLRKLRREMHMTPITNLYIGTTCADSLLHLEGCIRYSMPPVYRLRRVDFEDGHCESNYIMVR